MSDELGFANSVVKAKVVRSAHLLRGQLARSKRRDLREAWAEIETYLAVSLKVMDRTPLETIKSVAVTEEIKARLHGRPVE